MKAFVHFLQKISPSLACCTLEKYRVKTTKLYEFPPAASRRRRPTAPQNTKRHRPARLAAGHKGWCEAVFGSNLFPKRFVGFGAKPQGLNS
ncbi:hypothetical protein D5272_07260 [bacterium D16-76]|nr:hypothetical protein [bacterium D16-76]